MYTGDATVHEGSPGRDNQSITETGTIKVLSLQQIGSRSDGG